MTTSLDGFVADRNGSASRLYLGGEPASVSAS
jgi:hypothetical protein